MELRHLRYFVAVAEMENVSRAATKLHVSQPALSRQIRDLEDEIGVRLLERTAKSVRLTDAGRAFLEKARAILKDTDDAVATVRALGGKRETELHVGDFPLTTARLMPGLLRAYQKAMPNVKVKLHDWPVEKNIAGVREGRLQLAIIIPPLKSNSLDELNFEQLLAVRVCLAVSSDHPFARRKSVSLADAAREPFIGLMLEEYPRFQEYLAALFARVNDKPLIVEEHDGWAGVFSAVDAGTGVAMSQTRSLMHSVIASNFCASPLTEEGPDWNSYAERENLARWRRNSASVAREAFGTLGNPKFDPYNRADET